MSKLDKLIKPTSNFLSNGETNKFNRVLKVAVPGIAKAGTRFKLENGYYTNEEETIILRSTDTTGAFFTKEKEVRQ